MRSCCGFPIELDDDDDYQPIGNPRLCRVGNVWFCSGDDVTLPGATAEEAYAHWMFVMGFQYTH